MEFLEVKKDEIKELAQLAGEIWHEYWPCILTEAQINYMVEKFQSEKAIMSRFCIKTTHTILLSKTV